MVMIKQHFYIFLLFSVRADACISQLLWDEDGSDGESGAAAGDINGLYAFRQL